MVIEKPYILVMLLYNDIDNYILDIFHGRTWCEVIWAERQIYQEDKIAIVVKI